VSEIGFGCGGTAGLLIRGTLDEATSVVKAALDAGITFFDTSPLYGAGKSETNLGRVLKDLGATPIVSTKVSLDGNELDDIERAVRSSIERSKQRLHRDRLDAVILHNRIAPVRNFPGRVLSINDVLGERGVADAFERLRDEGSVRAIGITGLGKTSSVMQAVSSRRFDFVQAYYNILNPSAGVEMPYALRVQDFDQVMTKAHGLGIGVVVIRALAAGALSEGTALHPLAKDYPSLALAELDADRVRARPFHYLIRPGQTLSQAAIRFTLANAATSSTLVGISDRRQLAEAVGCSDGEYLQGAELSRIFELYADLYQTA
jgi:aryl-alcohol dehydrogenase-like predicted oxidoreductase